VENEEFAGTTGGLEGIQTGLDDRTEYHLGVTTVDERFRYLSQQPGRHTMLIASHH